MRMGRLKGRERIDSAVRDLKIVAGIKAEARSFYLNSSDDKSEVAAAALALNVRADMPLSRGGLGIPPGRMKSHLCVHLHSNAGSQNVALHSCICTPNIAPSVRWGADGRPGRAELCRHLPQPGEWLGMSQDHGGLVWIVRGLGSAALTPTSGQVPF